MHAAKPAVQKCYDRFRVRGLVRIKVRILGSGRVGKHQIRGAFAGTPTGACVAQAVRDKARFPAFRDPSIEIVFPFVLR